MVSEPIAQYLASLRKRLTKHLPQPLVGENLREIEGHLHANVQGRLLSGEPETAAQVAAVKDLGSDYLVADGLIRAHSGIDGHSAMRHAAIPIAIVLFVNMACSLENITMQFPLVLRFVFVYTGPLFQITFLLAIWRSRRILLGPMLVVNPATLAMIVGSIEFLRSTHHRTDRLRQVLDLIAQVGILHVHGFALVVAMNLGVLAIEIGRRRVIGELWQRRRWA